MSSHEAPVKSPVNPTFNRMEDGTYDDENSPDGFIISQRPVGKRDFDIVVLEGDVHFNPIGAETHYWVTRKGERISNFLDYGNAVRFAEMAYDRAEADWRLELSAQHE
jgi:hypothetical protein